MPESMPKLKWNSHNSSLFHHLLTTLLQHPEIRLCIWRRTDDIAWSAMTRRDALAKLVKIAFPSKIGFEEKFMGPYMDAVDSKLSNARLWYLASLEPENEKQLTKEHKDAITRLQPVWHLIQELNGDTPKADNVKVTVESPVMLGNKGVETAETKKTGGLMTFVPKLVEPEKVGDLKQAAELIKKEGATNFKETAPKGGAGNLITEVEKIRNLHRHRSLQKSVSDKHSENPGQELERAEEAGLIEREVKSRAATSSEIVKRRKRSCPDSEVSDGSEERKLRKGRKLELDLINAKIRLVKAETKLARLSRDRKKD